MLDTEYEKKLRQSLCIFPALTAAVATIAAAAWGFDEQKLHFHFDTVQETVLWPLLILVIFGGFTVAEMYSKAVFLLRETIRLVFGVGALSYIIIVSLPNPSAIFALLIPAMLISMPFILPLLIYWRKSKAKKAEEIKEFMEKIQEEEKNDGQAE